MDKINGVCYMGEKKPSAKSMVFWGIVLNQWQV